jgi:SAM-dependent methyltransferase
MTYLKRLANSLREDRVSVTWSKIVEHVQWRIREVKASDPIYRVRLFFDRQFDRKYGVDTSGRIGIQVLDLDAEQKSAGYRYEATPVPALRSLLKALDIDHAEFTFIDYGSGKGRVLLLASEYPFKKIIGVEFSKQLHMTTLDNIKVWQNRNQKCFDIESVCADARYFELPSGPLVLFFFTPFPPPVAKEVIDKIKNSYRSNPRPMRVVFYGTNTHFIELLSGLGFSRRDVYFRRPLSASKHWRGMLFWTNG